jgi:broad specificity phosphatase PhoE
VPRNPQKAVQTCRVIFVRHAIAQGNGQFNGHRDVPLAPNGRRQLPGLIRRLSSYSISAVFSSDLRRARHTADAVANKLAKHCESRRGLREMYFGKWEGLSWEQILARYPLLSQRWLNDFVRQPIPGAEVFDSFVRRVRREMRAIVHMNPNQCVLLVTHAGVIRVALASALRMQPRHVFRITVPPCSISVVDHFKLETVVRCINA